MHTDNDDELEKLRMENELKKMKLMLERGAVFSESIDSNKLDPVIEDEFLRNMEEFEKSFGNAEQISVYDFIERPEYDLVDTIPDSQITDELGKFMGILNENGISLDTLCEVEDRELYRFITEELFLQEVDNVRIKGMMSCFIYEEFHPNHEHDIRETCTDGIKFFMAKETQFYTYAFDRGALLEPWFTDFNQAYSSFALHSFYIGKIRIDDDSANVSYTIDFSGTIEGTSILQRFTGEGYITLNLEYQCWQIEKIHFPEAL